MVLPALRQPSPDRGRDRLVRPLLVQPGRRRAGDGVLHPEGAGPVPPAGARRRVLARRQRDPAVQAWFTVSQEEQLARFDKRREGPLRSGSCRRSTTPPSTASTTTPRRAHQMLLATDTQVAPWIIVNSNEKRRARLGAIRAVLAASPTRARTTSWSASPTPTSCVRPPPSSSNRPGADQGVGASARRPHPSITWATAAVAGCRSSIGTPLGRALSQTAPPPRPHRWLASASAG